MKIPLEERNQRREIKKIRLLFFFFLKERKDWDSAFGGSEVKGILFFRKKEITACLYVDEKD